MGNEDFYNTLVTEQEYDQDNQPDQRQRVKRAKYVLSFLLATCGVVILGSQLGPLAVSYAKGKILEAQLSSIKDPATAQELAQADSDLPYYDPGLSYFQNVIMHISPDYVAGASTGPGGNNSQTRVKIDREYSSTMKLSIPNLEIYDVPITPNVDSFDEDVYDEALNRGLAHFLGTAIPGDGGNSFIYGHSTVDSFFNSNENYAPTIFSKLESAEISDKITIEKDGKILEYAILKKKITNPDDFQVLSGIPGKETVTLMTCWPNGIGSQRLIIIAERTNG